MANSDSIVRELLGQHEILDGTRFGHVAETLGEIKDEIKTMRSENSDQHKEARQLNDNRFDKLETKLDALTAKPQGFIESLSLRQKVMGVVIVGAVGARIGWEPFVGLVEYVRGLLL